MKQSGGRRPLVVALTSLCAVLAACSSESPQAAAPLPLSPEQPAPLLQERAAEPSVPAVEDPGEAATPSTEETSPGGSELEGSAPVPLDGTGSNGGEPEMGSAPAEPVTPTAPPQVPDAPPSAPEAPPVVAPPADANLPQGVASRFPSAGAAGICVDVPLRLSFAGDVTLGNTGRIQIFSTAQPDVAVDNIDMAATAFTDTIAGRATNLVRPVFVQGRDAVVYFRHDVLQPNTSYFVRVDPGVFRDGNGNALAAVADNSWNFSTGALPGPAATLTVQREGAGNFCTIQKALDTIPANNATPVTLDIRDGTYHEILYLTRKNNVTLRGQSRDGTVISYPNNDRLNAGTAARSMVTVLTSNDFTIENLTLHNTTPQGGSQAEALRVRGDRAILRNANFLSLQDTVLLEGRVYVADSYIEGNVDFVWGQGATYFERSEIKLVGRSGVIVQSRNAANGFGYVFVDSRLTSDPGLTNSQLARIDATVYPASHVAFINCQMGTHITPAGWTITPAGADTSGIRFWEFQSTNLAGQPLNVSQRLAGSRQISANEAAQMRDKALVLGGWNPTP